MAIINIYGSIQLRQKTYIFKNYYIVVGGKTKPILITGYGGSGKSIFALHYEKYGYYKIECDVK